MGAGGKVLVAVLHPLHGPLEDPGKGGDDRLLHEHVRLDAEAAADRRRDNADLRLRYAERPRDLGLQEMGDLSRAPDRELAAAALVLRDDAAPLEGDARVASMVEPLGEDVVGLGERPVHVSVALLDVGDVVLAQRLVEDRGVGLQRLLRVEHGW